MINRISDLQISFVCPCNFFPFKLTVTVKPFNFTRYMAPVKKASQNRISFEDAYPLKPTKAISSIKHASIWKNTLAFIRKKFLNNFTVHTITFFSRQNRAKLNYIREQLEQRYSLNTLPIKGHRSDNFTVFCKKNRECLIRNKTISSITHKKILRSTLLVCCGIGKSTGLLKEWALVSG